MEKCGLEEKKNVSEKALSSSGPISLSSPSTSPLARTSSIKAEVSTNVTKFEDADHDSLDETFISSGSKEEQQLSRRHPIKFTSDNSESDDEGGVRFRTESVSKSPTSDLNKVASRTVFFHSVTCSAGEKKIVTPVDCLSEMMNGNSFVKVKASGRQFRRFFYLEEDLSGLRWMPSSKKSSRAKLAIKTIKEVRTGKSTEVMRNKDMVNSNVSEDCVFSIIFGDDFESLDLMASSPEEANIWVTGINFLISSTKSKDAMESRNKMREKWLLDVFDEADASNSGLLGEVETIELMKRLNSQLCPAKLRQKIVELDLGARSEGGKGISKENFVTLFNEINMRPDVYFILIRYSGKDYMMPEDLQLFLEGEEGICGTSLEECQNLIQKYERSEEARKKQQLLIDGFTQLLLSPSSQIMDPNHVNEVHQDMSHPLPCYFIASSHNSICSRTESEIVPGELLTLDVVDRIKTCLLQGCRSIKIDCFDGPEGPLVSTRSSTLQTHSLDQLLQAINENAFTNSPYPLIIQLENHCNVQNQKLIAKSLTQILGEAIWIPKKEGKPFTASTASPSLLKNKILIEGKKLIHNESESGEVSDEEEEGRVGNVVLPSMASSTSRVSTTGNSSCFKKMILTRELSDLISIQRVKCMDFVLQHQKDDEVSSFCEVFASKLALSYPEQLVHHNKSFLTRIIPNRLDMSNINPLDFWDCGCQLVGMNFSAPGQSMDLHRGWFAQNANCGYVLKPAFLRERFCLFNARRKNSLPGIDPLTLRLKIISGQQLPFPRGASCKATAIDPFVTIQLHGISADCAEARTRTISNGANCPMFDESFEFTISVPELALLRFLVLDDEYINDDFIGQATIPVECIQPGYRHVPLLSLDGDPIPSASLFVHISMTHRLEGTKQKLRRKRSWSNKDSSEMRSVGIKIVDDQFKSASIVFSESSLLRREVEKSWLELFDECSLSESANIAQALRVIVLRLASCPGVTSIEISKCSDGKPSLKAYGEMTPKIGRAMVALDKVLTEFHSASQSTDKILVQLTEIHDKILDLGNQLTTLCTSVGIKAGRKADKVAENFMWNLSLLKTEIDILQATRADTICALEQVLRLKVALERLFVRERENVPNVDESSSIQDHLQIPVITSTTGATVSSSPLLTPDTEGKKLQLQQLSPSSPSTSSTDGKLRGILKKSPASSISNLPDDVQDKSSLDQVTGGQISDSSSSSPRTSIS